MISLELLFEETKNIGKDLSVSQVQNALKESVNLNLKPSDVPLLHPPGEGSGDHLSELSIAYRDK